jgi:hypothetical protein
MFKRQSPVRTKGKVKRRVIDPNKRMLIGQILIGVMLFSVFGLVLSGIWYGTRIGGLTIVTVTATGGETIDHEKVQSIVMQTLEGAYLGLIPRQFAWTYPQEEVYEALGLIPRLKDPVVRRESGTELSVTFDEYVPYALWCTERTEGECVLIDEMGYAFAPAPKLKGGALIRYRTLGTEPLVGTSITAKESLATIAEFIALVQADGKFDIVAVETDSVGDVFYIVAGGGEFKAALRDPAPVVYDNLRTILGSKEFSDIAPGNFQYIDLRFGSKVFVNDQEAGVASTTATSSISTPDTTATTTPQ